MQNRGEIRITRRLGQQPGFGGWGMRNDDHNWHTRLRLEQNLAGDNSCGSLLPDYWRQGVCWEIEPWGSLRIWVLPHPGAPIRQDPAVTGSVNQMGEVQAIGGVNEKIEGFFEICQTRGLTGEQGVVIPENNVTNLILKDEVVQAV